ncbi:hypothetical protein BJY52DRAFT_158494 [Lactarius psammicola]|nr:hypothetical protein BJY52DRAFT_158494 [Lactarius psammicola]
MDESTTGFLLKILPNELITNILATLHYRDLASCTQVCRRLADIIRGSALLQYHLELGRCGMDDGPLSTLSIPQRRERLQAYDDAWKSLRWSACINVLNIPDNAYNKLSIAPGGILTFISGRDSTITFVQIPSNLRGIPMRQWELSFPLLPRACALDPSEDILVILQLQKCYLQFLSLSTGKPHPLAAALPLCDYYSISHSMEFVEINVAQNHVAVLVINQRLRVWNWKTGQILLDITPKNVRSVSFLPENRILVSTAFLTDDFAPGATPNGHGKRAALVMYDLDQTPASQQQGAAAPPVTVFALELGHDIIPVHLNLYYHPNIHPNSHEVAVPFFSAPTDQLIALQATGMLTDDRSIVLGHVLLIPLVKLTSHIGSTSAGDTPTRYIPWNNWASIGIRRVPDPNLSGYFRHALSGSRFIPRPETGDLVDVIDVWDFSRAGVVLESQRRDREFLPCVQKQLILPSQIEERVVAMISEDAVVIREFRTGEQRIYLLVF